MKRALKWLAVLVGALILLLVITVIVVPFFVDANAYRDDIARIVERQTGRELTIGGDMELSLFPWVGVEIHQVRLGNAEGFGPEPFARVREAGIKVRLLPLLRQEVEMDTLLLDGLRLHLARNAQGRTNWDDLVTTAEERPPEKPAEEPRDAPPLAGVLLGGIQVRDAHITWNDAVTGRQAEIRQLNLTSGALTPGEPFPLTFEMDVKASEPQLAGHIAFDSQLMVDPEAKRYAVEDAELSAELLGPLFPTGRLDAALATSATADLGRETAQLDRLVLTAYGAELAVEAEASQISKLPQVQGGIALSTEDTETLARLLGSFGLKVQPAALQGANASAKFQTDLAAGTALVEPLRLEAVGVEATATARATDLLQQPTVTGTLAVEPFVPRDVMEALGVEVPEPADPSALTKAALTTEFAAGTDRVALKGLKAQLDETRLAGAASVARFEAPVIRFDLRADAIDLDRYLPEGEEGAPPATPAEAATAGAAQLPVETLRALDVEGTARIGKLKVSNLRSNDIRVTVRAENGLFRAHPATAELYGGTYQGDMRLDVRQEIPQIALDERLTGVQSGPLLEDLLGEPYVTGDANVTAEFTARGLDAERVRRTLTGNGAFEFRDGAVNGINVAHLIRVALAKYRGQPVPEAGEQETDFAILRGTLTAKDGLVRNNDLTAKSPLLRVDGQGTANLVSEQLDYRVRAAIVGTLEGQGGRELEELQGVVIPVRITGTFDDPQFAVDVAGAIEERAKAEVEKRLEEEKQQLEKRFEEELQERFKGLFR